MSSNRPGTGSSRPNTGKPGSSGAGSRPQDTRPSNPPKKAPAWTWLAALLLIDSSPFRPHAGRRLQPAVRGGAGRGTALKTHGAVPR